MYIVIAIPAGATCRAARIAALFVERSFKLPEIKSTRIMSSRDDTAATLLEPRVRHEVARIKSARDVGG